MKYFAYLTLDMHVTSPYLLDPSNPAPLLPSKSNHLSNLSTPTLSSGGYKHSRGSFLKHDSNTLRRLSSLTAATPKAGGMTNGFVFHKKPGAVADEQGDKSKPQVVCISAHSEFNGLMLSMM